MKPIVWWIAGGVALVALWWRQQAAPVSSDKLSRLVASNRMPIGDFGLTALSPQFLAVRPQRPATPTGKLNSSPTGSDFYYSGNDYPAGPSAGGSFLAGEPNGPAVARGSSAPVDSSSSSGTYTGDTSMTYFDGPPPFTTQPAYVVNTSPGPYVPTDPPPIVPTYPEVPLPYDPPPDPPPPDPTAQTPSPFPSDPPTDPDRIEV